MNTPRTFAAALAAAAVVATLAVATLRAEDESHEQTIALDAAPAAVQKTVKSALGDAGKLAQLTKETEDGKTVFEADYTRDGVECSVKVGEAGAELERERKIDVAALPDAVRKAVQAKYPNAKLDDAVEVTADKTTSYEVDVKAADGEHELKLDKAGKLLADKLEKDDEDEHEQKEAKPEQGGAAR